MLLRCFLLALLASGCARLPWPAETPAAAGDGSHPAAIGAELARFLARLDAPDSLSAVAAPLIAVMPLEDDSGFVLEEWNLGRGMAALLADQMALKAEWRVVPWSVVAEVLPGRRTLDTGAALDLGRLMRADLVLLGTIEEFNMERFSAGDPLLGGYKSYTGVVALEARVLRVAGGEEMGRARARSELVDRDLGLDLLGKPREQDRRFAGLREIAFGSSEFAATVLGRATAAAIEELLGELVVALRPAEALRGAPHAEILSVQADEVYVSLGSEDGVRVGHRFAVLPGLERARAEGLDPGQRLGWVEVAVVVGAHLSRVRVLSGAGSLREEDRLALPGGESGD